MKHCKTHNTHFFEFSDCMECLNTFGPVMYESVYKNIYDEIDQNIGNMGVALTFFHDKRYFSYQERSRVNQYTYLNKMRLTFGLHNHYIYITVKVHPQCESKETKKIFRDQVVKSTELIDELFPVDSVYADIINRIYTFEHVMTSLYKKANASFFLDFEIRVNDKFIPTTTGMNRVLNICSMPMTVERYMQDRVVNPPFPDEDGLKKYARYEGTMAIMPEMFKEKNLLREYVALYGIVLN